MRWKGVEECQHGWVFLGEKLGWWHLVHVNCAQVHGGKRVHFQVVLKQARASERTVYLTLFLSGWHNRPPFPPTFSVLSACVKHAVTHTNTHKQNTHAHTEAHSHLDTHHMRQHLMLLARWRISGARARSPLIQLRSFAMTRGTKNSSWENPYTYRPCVCVCGVWWRVFLCLCKAAAASASARQHLAA